MKWLAEMSQTIAIELEVSGAHLARYKKYEVATAYTVILSIELTLSAPATPTSGRKEKTATNLSKAS